MQIACWPFSSRDTFQRRRQQLSDGRLTCQKGMAQRPQRALSSQPADSAWGAQRANFTWGILTFKIRLAAAAAAAERAAADLSEGDSSASSACSACPELSACWSSLMSKTCHANRMLAILISGPLPAADLSAGDSSASSACPELAACCPSLATAAAAVAAAFSAASWRCSSWTRPVWQAREQGSSEVASAICGRGNAARRSLSGSACSSAAM